jgi:hypothetical protein
MDEHGGQEEEEKEEKAHNEQAWERYMEAERRELEMRQEGHLAKLLGFPLSEESLEELERLAKEDQRRAFEGLVEVMSESGEITYKHIDDLTPKDRSARIRAEGKWVEWVAERQARKAQSLGSSGSLLKIWGKLFWE